MFNKNGIRINIKEMKINIRKNKKEPAIIKNKKRQNIITMNTKMQNFIAISDLISLMNMSSGFISILLSINHNFHLAAILMIFSLMFDSIDGWVARKTNRNDEYGFIVKE